MSVLVSIVARRIHAAWLNELYNWLTIERELGNWSVVSTEDPSIRIDFDNEDKAEAHIDHLAARAAAVFVLCFWRRKP